MKVPSESNTGSLNLPFYGNSLAFSCRIPITQVRGSSKSPCCSTHEQTLFFFVLLPASLPPAKATLQVITTITPVAHTRTPELCYAADENAMEEKAGFTTSDHKKKMTSDPLHGEVPRRSHLLFASTSLRRKKRTLRSVSPFGSPFRNLPSGQFPSPSLRAAQRSSRPTWISYNRISKLPPFFAGLRDRQMELDGLD